MKLGNQTTTLNWDTVFAIPVSKVNRIIKEERSSPMNFKLNDLEYNDFSGDFGDWQITPGGDGNSIRMNIPILNFKTNIRDDLLSGNFGFKSANLDIQVKLKYLPHDEDIMVTDKEKKYALKVRTESNSPIDPVVIGISLNNIDGFFYNKINKDLYLNIIDILKQTFMRQIVMWLNLNLNKFKHIFNVVNINLYISSEEPWSWCKPTYIDYAYADIEDDLDKSLLGVLCMTGGRTGGISQQQKIDSSVIPESSECGFLISEERFLRDVLLPTLPKKFKNSSINDYEVINSSNESGKYSYTLKLKDDKNINLDKLIANGGTYTPIMKHLELSLSEDTMKFETYIETPIGSGITTYCSTINEYRVVLAKNKKGEETITYEEVREPTILKGTTSEESALPWVMIVLELISLAILAVVTSGATLFIAGIVVSLVYGVITFTPSILENLNVDTSPSIDLLLENTTSQIVWKASDIFKLNYARLSGPLKLGGTFM